MSNTIPPAGQGAQKIAAAMSVTRGWATIALVCLLTPISARAERAPAIGFVSPTRSQPVSGATPFAFALSRSAPDIERIEVSTRNARIGTALPPHWRFTWTPEEPLVDEVVIAEAFAGDALVERIHMRTAATAAAAEGELVYVPSVMIYPVVTDGREHQMRALTAANFAVLDEGKPVAIESFANARGPFTAALLIDRSESMETELPFVKQAAARFIARLQDEDGVAVYGFDETVSFGPPPSRDKAAAKAALDAIQLGRRTAIFDAITRVVVDLQLATGRRALLLFSDGEDTASSSSLGTAMRRALEENVIVYAIGFGAATESVAARRYLTWLADETGGLYRSVSSRQQLDSAYGEFFTDLRAQYSLSYRPPAGTPGPRSIAVKLRDVKEGCRVRARRSYLYNPPAGAGAK
ncbi:MAG: VWA domain-containing protein [Candidatus Schekmanbacteria bacterium]|nr:VWA domain-containing protein [Candidatus Schekmanbacteria bacterium]